MNIFLIWHHKNITQKDYNLLADKIIDHYQPHIKQKLSKYVYLNERSGIILISDKPLTGNTYFLQEADNCICFSAGTPTGFNILFSKHKVVDSSDDNHLLKLWELFHLNGFSLIKYLSPPFIFGFIDKSLDSIQIVHDGYGFEQGFIYEDEDMWVCSNKCWPIIEFSDKIFNPDNSGWRHYFDIGWFPLSYTPFKEISIFKRGEIWVCCEGKVSKDRYDCFFDWLKPLKMEKDDILEFARIKFNESVVELCNRYGNKCVRAHLSGGKDTRMILSSIINQNIDCVFETNGDSYSADVKIAELIEKQFHLNVQYGNPSLDNVNIDDFYTKINKFIEWQEGFGDTKLAKYKRIIQEDLSSPPPFSGLGGEIHRAHFYPYVALSKSIVSSIKAIITRLFPNSYLFLSAKLEQHSPVLRSKDELEKVKWLIFLGARKYGLKKYFLLDYYYIVERSGRWAAVSSASDYNGYLLPFLNIDLLQSTFSLSENDRRSHALHKYTITTNVRDLDKIPYDRELVSSTNNLIKIPYDENIFWRTAVGVSIMDKMLNQDHYVWDYLLDKKAVKIMWEDHIAKKAKNGEFFWRIVGFYFWYSQFVSGKENR